MAKVEINDDDVFEALTECCRNAYPWKNKNQTCFSYQRCDECEDGRILSFTGRRVARLMQKPAPKYCD